MSMHQCGVNSTLTHSHDDAYRAFTGKPRLLPVRTSIASFCCSQPLHVHRIEIVALVLSARNTIAFLLVALLITSYHRMQEGCRYVLVVLSSRRVLDITPRLPPRYPRSW